MTTGNSTEEAGHPWDDLNIPVAKTVERPHAIKVIYHRSGSGWRASSPHLRRLNDQDTSLEALRSRVEGWLQTKYGAAVVEQVAVTYETGCPPEHVRADPANTETRSL